MGAGGMGKVYRARDTRLDRFVALKVLGSEIASPHALERFDREAKAIAALNHPNICTVHDVGVAAPENADGGATGAVPYIVMELLDGETLQQRLARAPFDVATLLDTALALADALSVAHAQGIIHRDLKPANIILTKRGPKILDFGLAQVTAAAAGEPITEWATLAPSRPLTDPGVTVGTLAYMSPEQIKGEPVDARTDIFSLGLVLYEMAAGRHAFPGATSAAISAAILRDEPVRPRTVNPALPARLDQAIVTALEKDRDIRTQTASELRAELTRVKRELGSLHDDQAAVAAGTAPPSAVSSARPASGSSDAQIVVGIIRRHRAAVAAVAAVALLAIAAAVYMAMRPRGAEGANSDATFTIADLQVQPLTTSGNASSGAISPDGNYIVYVQTDGGRESLRLRRIASPTSVEIVPAAAGVRIKGATVAPDGNVIDYVRQEGQRFELWRVGFLGGEPKRLIDNIGSLVSWSPDGRQMAFIRADRNATSILTADADGNQQRVVATRSQGERFWAWTGALTLGAWYPAWSPNGRVLAVLGQKGPPATGQIVFVEVATGAQRAIDAQPPLLGTAVAWMDDGNLLVSKTESSLAPLQLWRLSYATGTLTRLTNDVSQYLGLSVTGDKDAVATEVTQWNVGIWTRGGNDPWREVVPSAIGSQVGFNVQWAGDDLIFTRGFASSLAVARLRTASGQIQELAPGAGAPLVSRDGRTVLFFDYGSGRTGRMDADGRNRTDLAFVPSGFVGGPALSADGRRIAHRVSDGVKVIAFDDDGNVHDVATLHVPPGTAFGRLNLSPDGSRLLIPSLDEQRQPTTLICDLDTCSSPQRLPPLFQAGWATDGRGITYVDAATQTNLWVHPLDGSPPHKLTDFPDDGRTIAAYAWSSDGTRLAVARGASTHDIVLVKGFKRALAQLHGGTAP
jgi:Tol biopolymer transport system component